jgi:hypothetical protein
LDSATPPSGATSDPAKMIAVGSSRKTPTYAKNGRTPSHVR